MKENSDYKSIVKLYLMNIVSKKCAFLSNICIGLLFIVYLSWRVFRATNSTILFKRHVVSKVAGTQKIQPTAVQNTLLQLPWRFQIEEDGFVFPNEQSREKFLSYEPVNGSWIEQLLQFENACVFAYLLNRTIIVPKLKPYISNLHHDEKSISSNKTRQEVSFFSVIDSSFLSQKIKLKEMSSEKDILDLHSYGVCLDSRLGFWMDYIPSVENIQTWRLLRQQNFTPVNLNTIREDVKCHGTVFGKWTYPAITKTMYRGILTELFKRSETLVYFHGGTLGSNQLRFFDKQRTIEMQELLLFSIRFTPLVMSRMKLLLDILSYGYTAIYVDEKSSRSNDTITYVERNIQILDPGKISKNILVVVNSTYFETIQQKLKVLGYRVYNAERLVVESIPIDQYFTPDFCHLLSLLLCVNAKDFIGVGNAPNLYYIRHLRLKDLEIENGVVIDNINVKWAKFTTRKKVQRKETLKMVAASTQTYATKIYSNKNTSLTHHLADKFRKFSISIKQSTKRNITRRSQSLFDKKNYLKRRRTKDQSSNMVCLFCNYIRHITGKHGCPKLRDIC